MPKNKKNHKKQQENHKSSSSSKNATLKSCLKEVPKAYKNTKKKNDEMDKLCDAMFSLTRRKLARNKISQHLITIYDCFAASDQTRFLYYFADELLDAFKVCLKRNKPEEVVRVIPIVALKLLKNEKVGNEAVELIEMLNEVLANRHFSERTKANCAKCLCVVLYVLNDDMQEIYSFMDELVFLINNTENLECTAEFLKCFGFLLTVIPKSTVLELVESFLSVLPQMLKKDLDMKVKLEVGKIVGFLFEENHYNLVYKKINVTDLEEQLHKHAFNKKDNLDDNELFRLLLRKIKGRDFKIKTETILKEEISIYSLKYQIRFLFFEDLFNDLDLFCFYYQNSYLLKELLQETPKSHVNKGKIENLISTSEQIFEEKIKAEEKLENNTLCCRHITFNDRTYVKEFCKSDYEYDSN